MIDIVKRLRGTWEPLDDEAANEIERLRVALNQIADGKWNKGRTGKLLDYRHFARAALEGKL